MMDKLDFRFEIKELATDPGKFTGLASVYGVLDQQGDIVERGAFTKTLAVRDSVPILFQHLMTEPIGLGKLEDSREGLLIHGTLCLSENQTAKKAYALLKAGVLRGLSIGYQAVRKDVKAGVRYLREIKLHEVSLVTFPCCEEALVSDVKSVEANQVAQIAVLFSKYRITGKGL